MVPIPEDYDLEDERRPAAIKTAPLLSSRKRFFLSTSVSSLLEIVESQHAY